MISIKLENTIVIRSDFKPLTYLLSTNYEITVRGNVGSNK